MHCVIDLGNFVDRNHGQAIQEAHQILEGGDKIVVLSGNKRGRESAESVAAKLTGNGGDCVAPK
jgi:hypothetical protein